jgi:acyl-CoA reductase-like NAD-dependent aldehyde dehydrogenase
MRNSSTTGSTSETKQEISAESQDAWGALIGGRSKTSGPSLSIRSPFDGEPIAMVRFANASEIEEAISAAVQSFEATRHFPSWRRAEILERVGSMIREDREGFARTIALEAGKPIRTARTEVDRAIFTFKVAAEEAKRIYGEIVPLDWLPGAEGRVAHIRRVPRGPVVGISPFNFPLNLVAHKVAPALAAGNPIILRPASQTPISALKLGKIIVAAGWPTGAISVIPSAVKDASPLVEDERIKFLTFTGSPEVGWSLKKRAGAKPVTLELGGNAATIVHRDADVSHAASRVAWGGFTFAGQTCISVQRVYVHADIYQEFRERLLTEVQKLKVGNPLDEETDIGPVIDPAASERIGSWLEEATDKGAKVATGGTHEGNLWQPTIVESASENMKVSCKELFGPVVCLYEYTDVREALDRANHGDFGLQAGLFTENLELVERAFAQLDVGGLVVNDVSTFRMDHMPYGGVKQSGLGREGLRYAIQEMTEMKLLAINYAVSWAPKPVN